MDITYLVSQVSVQVIGSDCTNGGISQGATCLSPSQFVFAQTASGINYPGRDVVNKLNGGVVHVRAVPVIDGKPQLHGMFGGNWLISSDSRFPYATPVPLHDRFEEQA